MVDLIVCWFSTSTINYYFFFVISVVAVFFVIIIVVKQVSPLLVSQLVGWLLAWLLGCLVGWLVGWLAPLRWPLCLVSFVDRLLVGSVGTPWTAWLYACWPACLFTSWPACLCLPHLLVCFVYCLQSVVGHTGRIRNACSSVTFVLNLFGVFGANVTMNLHTDMQTYVHTYTTMIYFTNICTLCCVKSQWTEKDQAGTRIYNL